MTPRLQVLAVLPAGGIGGAEEWLLNLLAATERLEVRAVCLADGPVVARLRSAGIPTAVLPTGRRVVDGLRPALALMRLLRRSRPDVLLANGVKAAALALPVAALVGTRTVWIKHDFSYDDLLARPLAVLATRVVATDPTIRRTVPRDDVVVVVPAAPAAPARRLEARRALSLTEDELVLAVVGRLVDYKGVDDAITALSLPAADGWKLVVLGDDDPDAPGDRDRLSALTASLGLEDRVRFLGHVPGAGRLLSGADAVGVLTKPVATRSPGAEGFGLTALEAARAGTPVIAVDGSAPMLRMAGRAGLGVPPGSPAHVAEALGRLRDPALRAQMGRAGIALSQDHPDAARCAEVLVQVLAEAAGLPGQGLPRTPVSVVVTVRDEVAAVRPLVARVLEQLGLEDEMVVVDGGSTDGTVAALIEVARSQPRLQVLERPGAGISEGRNIGVRSARHPVVACTDAGCVPVAGWLAALAQAFSEAEPAGLVTGVYRVTAPSGRRWEQALAAVGYPSPQEARRPTLLVRVYGAVLGRTVDPGLPTGRSMAFDRRAFEAAGGFPEHLATGEDVTFGQQLLLAGGRAVLATGAEVAWDQRPTLQANLAMYRSYGRGDGLSGDHRLVGRNLARAVAYPLGLGLLARGSTASRAFALVGALSYLSLPAGRVAAEHPGALPLVPVVAALRDAAKAWGCMAGVRARRRT